MHSVIKYAYSNARIKARKSRILTKDFMAQLSATADLDSALVMLMSTDYKPEMEEYGGTQIKSDMIDFALSKNLASRVGQLSEIAPDEDTKLISLITGLWEINNMKIAIEAKERGASFDSISKYVIDYGRYGRAGVEIAMAQPNVEETIFSFTKKSQYKGIIINALKAYRASGNALVATLELDKGYYTLLGESLDAIGAKDPGSTGIVRDEITMKNVSTLLRCKKRGMNPEETEKLLVPYGLMSIARMLQVYSKTQDVEELADKLHLFGLGTVLDAYRNRGQLLIFEMHMRSSIFQKAKKLLTRSVLSFGNMVAYAYIKETEIFALREILKAKEYSLGDNLSSIVLNA
jgi:vacuolar-type H+-ATPase subunit C/Vma6